MGNDVSKLSGLEINEKAIEVTDFWAHHHATVNEKSLHFGIKTSGTISIFKGETAVLGSLWSSQSPLEKCSNNLIKYRHPSIVRYISSWRQQSYTYLATETVFPLSQMLHSQCSLQICVGLSSLLQALVFLHDTAKLSHNNVCLHSVYVTPDGTWKLGNLEYLRPFVDMNTAYLKQTRSYRYEKGIDPKEESHNNVSKIDQYAFCTLVDEVFSSRKDDEVPHLSGFKQYCHSYLQNADVALRPHLRNVLHHELFNHDFIAVHHFLVTLPLKTESEKAELFSGLMGTLHRFEEETVARQLGGLLLSRLVLLNLTAREAVLPQLLRPRTETPSSDGTIGFFTFGTFKKYITPKLLQVFCVRDAQIRSLLLIHFRNFIGTFTNEELTEHILPELLLGIKDTDDNLVAMTLRCLSDLIIPLGAATVIGGKRAKIFSDGRPMQHLTTKHSNKAATTKISNEVQAAPAKNFMNLLDYPCSEEVSQCSVDSVTLQERPSPDGGEDLEPHTVHTPPTEDAWSDWNENDKPPRIPHEQEERVASEEGSTAPVSSDRDYLQKAAIEAKTKKLTDISELDIKLQTNIVKRSNSAKEEFDFFADMEPVIEKANVLTVSQENSANNKFQFIPTDDNRNDDDENNSAWDDDWT